MVQVKPVEACGPSPLCQFPKTYCSMCGVYFRCIHSLKEHMDQVHRNNASGRSTQESTAKYEVPAYHKIVESQRDNICGVYFRCSHNLKKHRDQMHCKCGKKKAHESTAKHKVPAHQIAQWGACITSLAKIAEAARAVSTSLQP